MTTDQMPDFHGMHREYAAWRAFMEQLKLAAPELDFNAEPALHAAVTLWGEELHMLRSTQDDAVRSRAYHEARERFAERVGEVTN